jgi:hypothetical protein
VMVLPRRKLASGRQQLRRYFFQLLQSRCSHFFTFSRSDGFKKTPNLLAIFATVRGSRFICFATASSDLEDAASFINRRSSANAQWRFIGAAIYFEPFALKA